MPQFGPIKRKDLIKVLKHAGFEGPFTGGKHEFLVKGNYGLSYPIRIKARSAKIYLYTFCVKPI
jgi:predicted RNA binding protein YcfA (HicA-like mRNA interferase family)